MKMYNISNSLEYPNWGIKDLRSMKNDLVLATQAAVKKFEPVKPGTYKDSPIQLIDLFCGAGGGGTSLGFAALNSVVPVFNMLGGCDVNTVSAQTYSHNFGTVLINEDITELAYQDGKLDELLRRIEYDSNKPTVLIGCAPCQGFSSHRKKHCRSAAHKHTTLEVIRQVAQDGGNRPIGVGPACLDKTSGFSDVYGRLFWDKPSITITHYARNPASGRYTHPEQDRGLTAREAALLQSFPNGFEFTGKSDDIYRQIGEAVPPLLSSAVAVDILIELLSALPTADELKASPASIEKPVSSSYSSVIAGIKTRGKAVK